jgi:membrane protein
VLLLVMSLSALADRLFDIPVANTLRDWIDESAPVVLKPLLRQLVEKAITDANTGLVSVSAGVALLLAIWGASGAVGTLMAASTRAYGVKNSRHFFIRRAINSLLALLIVILIVSAVIFFLYGKEIGHWFLEWIGYSTSEPLILWVFRLGLFFVFTMVALTILYRVGTDIELNAWWLLPGAGIAAALWLGLLQGFSALLMVTNPGDPYGTFGAVVILLWFFYLTGVAFLVGTVINAVISRPYDKKRRVDFSRHPEKRMFCDDGTEAS